MANVLRPAAFLLAAHAAHAAHAAKTAEVGPPIPNIAFVQDLTHFGMTGATLCDRVQVSRATVTGWANGGTPAKVDGERLPLLWSHLNGKPAQFARSTNAPPGLLEWPVPALNGEAVDREAFAMLDGVVRSWLHRRARR